jgi:hypothetical protein
VGPVDPRDPCASAEDRLALRVALSRSGLGIELDAPLRMGPLRLVELGEDLPGVRFPVDLSGGVARFRHRRGVLARLALEAAPRAVAAHAAPALRGLLGPATPDVIVAPTEAGALVGMCTGETALAFDVVFAPVDGDLVFLPERARGLGLPAPAHVLAMRALAATLGAIGRAEGGAVVVAGAASSLVRHVLPGVGARAPATATFRWERFGSEELLFRAVGGAGAPPARLSDRALSALELAELVGDADAFARGGEDDRARRRYLEVLERAPRHPEIVKRLAALDAAHPDRAEAALATLVDGFVAVDAGALGGELLAAVGDVDGAATAFARAATDEPYGPLASLAWLRAAALTEDLDRQRRALDEAVTRAPALAAARWARLDARLALGDLRGAKADAEHLEAAAAGARVRHEAVARAADAFARRGYAAEATGLYERALRYAPDSVDAVAGLARALLASGQDRRAMDLLARAAALAARQGRAEHGVVIELSRALAEVARDLPAAIARAVSVPPDAPEGLPARGLEGRYRAALGDRAGASLAFARLRDGVERLGDAAPERRAELAAWLAEAARFEELERGDLVAARRHLGAAVRVRPHDRGLVAELRRVSRALETPAPAPPARAAPALDVRAELEPDDDTPPLNIELGELGAPTDDEGASADEEALVERLSDRLRADPSDRETVLALAAALARLRRDLDLLALVSAQIDEGDDALRAELAPMRREALIRLAAAAHDKGRTSEAELYEAMLVGE